jgi:hypothetical protein
LLAQVALLLHVGAAEGVLRVELVVGAAEDAEVVGVVVAAEGARVDVVELQKGAGAATPAVR